jgi:lysine 2,3-aminomutase
MIGTEHRHNGLTRQWERALAYIEKHTEVRDVLLSGGDPLALAEERLDWLLTRLRAIPHVEFVRLGATGKRRGKRDSDRWLNPQ